MIGKLERKVSRTTLKPGKTQTTKTKTVELTICPLKRRGRPKGAKNKPKQPTAPEVAIVVKHKGRPKGAKNKPKTVCVEPNPKPVIKVSQVKQTEKSLQSKKPAEVKTPPPPAEHVLLTAARWIEKNMHPSQVQYYRARASRAGITIHHSMISDILGFFNVRECELTKQIKKNNFIASTQNHELHQ
jgi:hypothetical protein